MNTVLKKKIAPCKDCENRNVGCHSTCELYAAYKEDRTNEYMNMRESIGGELLSDSYKLKIISRIRKRCKRR